MIFKSKSESVDISLLHLQNVINTFALGTNNNTIRLLKFNMQPKFQNFV